nr:MAG TPA: hypothetical protein [Caudoviricetes sp.]
MLSVPAFSESLQIAFVLLALEQWIFLYNSYCTSFVQLR